MFKRICLTLVLLMSPNLALAADPTGSWRMDSEQFREMLVEFLEPQLAELPENMRENMRNMMLQMFEGQQAEMAGVANFKSDGSAEFVSDSGEVSQGRWESQGGNKVLVIPEGGDPMEAEIDGDQMTARYDMPDMPGQLEMVWNRQ